MNMQRLKRGLAWLLMTLLVLGAVAGCGSQAPAASQRQAVTAGPGQEAPATDRQDTGASDSRQFEATEASDLAADPAAGSKEPASGAKESPEEKQSRGAQSAEDFHALEENTEAEADTDIQTGADTRADADTEREVDPDALSVQEDGSYTTREEVALYLHTFGHLPDNYITKKEAENLGWDSKKGNLWEVAPGKSIGGSHFGNYEKQLPEKKGRKYYECDINYEGKYRGAERIIYSDDGLVFYTGDHYKTFEQLYP